MSNCSCLALLHFWSLDLLCGWRKRHAPSAADDGLALVGYTLVHDGAVPVPLDQGRQALLLVVPDHAAHSCARRVPSEAVEVR